MRGTGVGVGARSPRELWELVLGTQPDPPGAVITMTALLALLGVVHRSSWIVLNGFVTMLHEGGHALVAILTRRKITRITLDVGNSGAVYTVGRPKGFGKVVTSLAGYPAPGLVALGAATLIARGKASLTLCLTASLVLLMLIKIRTLYGAFIITFFVGTLMAVAITAEPRVQSGFAHLLAWVLALGAIRPVVHLIGRRLRRSTTNDDAVNLAKATGLPVAFWALVFAAMVTATGIACAVLLVPQSLA